MCVQRHSRIVGTLGLGLLIVPLLGVQRWRTSSVPAPRPLTAPQPARSPSAAARWEARRCWARAVVTVNSDREIPEEWDPVATEGLNQETWRRQLMADDRHGDLRRALEAGRQAAALARTPEEAAALFAHLECQTGHHEAELEQARKLMALQPGSLVSLIVLRHAAICNHMEPLVRQTTTELQAAQRLWATRSSGR